MFHVADVNDPADRIPTDPASASEEFARLVRLNWPDDYGPIDVHFLLLAKLAFKQRAMTRADGLRARTPHKAGSGPFDLVCNPGSIEVLFESPLALTTPTARARFVHVLGTTMEDMRRLARGPPDDQPGSVHTTLYNNWASGRGVASGHSTVGYSSTASASGLSTPGFIGGADMYLGGGSPLPPPREARASEGIPPQAPAEEGKCNIRSKPGEKGLKDLDGIEWISSDGSGFGERIARTQALLRVLPKTTVELMMGHALHFDVNRVKQLIQQWHLMARMGFRTAGIHQQITSLGSIQDFVAFRDDKKLELFMTFEWSWMTPYALSLADCLPSSVQLVFWGKKASSCFRTALQQALTNFEALLRILLGVPSHDATAQLRALLADDVFFTVMPDAFLFNTVSMFLLRVLEAFRLQRPPTPGAYTGGAQLAWWLKEASGDAVQALRAANPSDFTFFLDNAYTTIKWHRPPAPPAGRGLAQKRNRGEDSSSEEGDDRPRAGRGKDRRQAGYGSSRDTTPAGKAEGGAGAANTKNKDKAPAREGDKTRIKQEVSDKEPCIFYCSGLLRGADQSLTMLPEGCRLGNKCPFSHPPRLQESAGKALIQKAAAVRWSKERQAAFAAAFKAAFPTAEDTTPTA